MAFQASTGAMRFGVARRALLFVETRIVTARILVGWVAVLATDAPHAIALALDQAQGLEPDVERIIGTAGGREAMAGGAGFHVRLSGALGVIAGMLFRSRMAALAIHARYGNRYFRCGGERGVAGEAGPDGLIRLHDADGIRRRCRGSSAMAKGEIEAACLGVVTDAMFDPAALRNGHRGHALITGAKGPFDAGAAQLSAAPGGYFQPILSGRIVKQEAVASLADGPVLG